MQQEPPLISYVFFEGPDGHRTYEGTPPAPPPKTRGSTMPSGIYRVVDGELRMIIFGVPPGFECKWGE